MFPSSLVSSTQPAAPSCRWGGGGGWPACCAVLSSQLEFGVPSVHGRGTTAGCPANLHLIALSPAEDHERHKRQYNPRRFCPKRLVLTCCVRTLPLALFPWAVRPQQQQQPVPEIKPTSGPSFFISGFLGIYHRQNKRRHHGGGPHEPLR